MKNLKFLLVGLLLTILTTSCSSTFNAPEILEDDKNRRELYKNIVSNQGQFEELLEVAATNEAAKKTLMQNHMQMMESGNMKAMMQNNPGMKEKMKSHMEKMMDDPEMQEKMHKMMQEKMDSDPEMKRKMKEKMMKDPAMREAMMEGMHSKMKSNPEVAEKMMDKMIQFLHENPELMEKMKAKMKAHQDKM